MPHRNALLRISAGLNGPDVELRDGRWEIGLEVGTVHARDKQRLAPFAIFRVDESEPPEMRIVVSSTNRRGTVEQSFNLHQSVKLFSPVDVGLA